MAASERLGPRHAHHPAALHPDAETAKWDLDPTDRWLALGNQPAGGRGGGVGASRKDKPHGLHLGCCFHVLDLLF